MIKEEEQEENEEDIVPEWILYIKAFRKLQEWKMVTMLMEF